MNPGSETLDASLRRVAAGERLSAAEAEDAIGALVGGSASRDQIAALLTGIARRGPSVDEIVGGARALRASMVQVQAPAHAIDVCGTGGDGHGTLNVSTAVGFVVAACGVPVAKHGNRAMSSRAGSADVLEALGVKIGGDAVIADRCLNEAGICFMFAQTHHPAMKHVAQVRRELGFRTIFNLLGPLANPARVEYQLIGVYDAELVEPVARAAHVLGATAAWVVHGSDGLDEISIAATTHVAALKDGKVTTFEVGPEDAAFSPSTLAALQGGDAKTNAAAIVALFRGARGPFRDIVLLNAAAALIVAGKVEDLRAGVEVAARNIDNGNTRKTLEELVRASNA